MKKNLKELKIFQEKRGDKMTSLYNIILSNNNYLVITLEIVLIIILYKDVILTPLFS